MKLTNKQFCARLRKAKKLAAERYPNGWFSIYEACCDVGIYLGENASFGHNGGGPLESFYYEIHEAESFANIARVFDASIRNLGQEP